MSLACRVHWSWVDRTGDTVNKVKGAWRAQHPKCSDNSQHLNCSLTAPRRAGTSFGFFFFVFFLLSQLSEPGRLGTALSGPASRLASAMTFSGCDTSPTVAIDCCSFSICRTQSPEELGRVGERSLGWSARLSCGDTNFFFFFFNAYAEERTRREGPRGDKILRWRHCNCTHNDACRRETAWVFPETSEVRAGRLSSRFRLRAYCTVQTRVVSTLESKRTPRDFPRLLFLYPLPSAAARTAPNGVKERASFCLVFRSLNTTSSHRMFSMGYRRAKSTQGNTNFQKRIFLANNFGITTRGP